MTPETSVFALTVVLGFVHILVCDVIQTRIHGVREMVGARDSFRPADNVYLGRARRANDNFRETAPWALGLLIMVQVAEVSGTVTAAGAWLYLIARVVYLPMYLFGVPWLRTLAWTISLLGIAMMLVPLLR
jgi:uncharacterized MAPEG superfamily protein